MLDVKLSLLAHPENTASDPKSLGLTRFGLFRITRLEPFPAGVARKLRPSKFWSCGFPAMYKFAGGQTVFWKVVMSTNAVLRIDNVPKVLR
jgi:hypothetical protein